MIDREAVTALRQCSQMFALGRAEVAKHGLLEFDHEGGCQRAIGFQEIQAWRERGGIAERRGGHVAEHPDLLVAHHQAPQHLYATQHHGVIDASHQAGGLDEGQEIFGREHLIILVANSRHRFVEADFALRQGHHRLQVDVEPVFLDRGFDRRQRLHLAARGGSRLGFDGNRRRRGHRWGDNQFRGLGGKYRLLSRRVLGAGGWRGGRYACGQDVVMAGHRHRELLHQPAKFVDFADHRLDAVRSHMVDRGEPSFDCGEPAAEFSDLAGEIRSSARQIRDLAADIGPIAQPHRYGIVEDQEGQRGEGGDRRFHAADSRNRIQDEAEGGGDEHHADGDENRGNADHLSQRPPGNRRRLGGA